MGMILSVIVLLGAVLMGCAPKQVEEPRYASTLYEVEFPEEELDDLPEADTGEATEEDDEQ